MKNKKHSLCLLLFSIFSFLFFIFSKTFAQSSNFYLSVIPYQTREDLDILFSQSTRVLDYFEGEGVEKPIFLTIITEPQRQNLLDKGFKIRIVDSLNNLNDISNYTLLYHPKPNQSNLLTNLGKVFVVSKHYTILKTTPDKPFKHEGVAAKFFVIPINNQVVTPPYRTKTIIPTQKPSPSFTPLLIHPLFSGKTVLLSLFFTLLISGVSYLWLKKRKKKIRLVFIILLFLGVFLIIYLTIAKLILKPNYPTLDLEIPVNEKF